MTLVTPNKPSKPTELAASSVSKDGVTLTWQVTADELVNGFAIVRDGSRLANVYNADDVTTYTDTSVEAGTDYSYKVMALNGLGFSPKSAAVEVSVPDPE